MPTQRKKDWEEAVRRTLFPPAFVDGAAFGRKDVGKRLRTLLGTLHLATGPATWNAIERFVEQLEADE